MDREGLENQNQQRTTVDARDATYQGVGQVVHGSVSQQTITKSNVTNYTVDPEERPFVEVVSKLLHQHVGDRRAAGISWGTIAAGVFGLLPQLTQKPLFLAGVAYPLFWVGVFLLAIGITVRLALGYKASRTCPDCDTHYALQEYKDAEVEDVTVNEGVRRKTSRFLRCTQCGHEDVRVQRELIEE